MLIYVNITQYGDCFIYTIRTGDFYCFIGDKSVEVTQHYNLNNEELDKVLLEHLGNECEVYTLSCYTKEYLQNKGIQAYYLNEKLGYTTRSLYKIYCSEFGTPINLTQEEMIRKIMVHSVWKAVVKNCIVYKCSVVEDGYNFDFSLFSITKDGYMKILGNTTYFVPNDNYIYCNTNNVLTELKKNITDKGISENSLLGYRLDKYDSIMVKFHEQYEVEFPDYLINSLYLGKLLSKICMVKNIPLRSVYDCLSKRVYQSDMEWDTLRVVSAFSDVSKKAMCYIDNNEIGYDKNYYVDFSSKVFVNSKADFASYGFILDCEGKADGGCSEIGAVLYGQYDDKIVIIKEYEGREEALSMILKSMVADYQKYTKKRNTKLPVLVYDEMDKSYIKISLLEMNETKSIKLINKNMDFINTRAFIENVMKDKNIETPNYKLSTVAESIGVAKKRPLHNALNDSKTLFNVLSGLLVISGRFII